jgi:hypothetical protein
LRKSSSNLTPEEKLFDIDNLPGTEENVIP